MPHDENSQPATGRRQRENALQLGPRKKPCVSDPLVHLGRHFGRTIHALSAIRVLLVNGILRIGELVDKSDEAFTAEERREHRVFRKLLNLVPGLEERLMESSEEETRMIADLIQKGASSARSDDTRSLKGSIIDWITPRGQSLDPPLARNIKTDRGFNHERTGALLCPAGMDWTHTETRDKLRRGELVVSGDQWPIFLFNGYHYDPEDPWNGLFRSSLLISAYKHIFTSPSSAEREPKATRSGNARIHGMTQVTPASIAYVATQVRFALSSSPVFSRTDTATDSECFYTSIVDFFEDPDEADEVRDLMVWWNRQVFPVSSGQRLPAKDGALARIKVKRAAMKAIAENRTG